MGEKVKRVGFDRKGKRVYVDSDGDISFMMNKRKAVKVGVKREKGYLYYVDSDGDVSRSKMRYG